MPTISASFHILASHKAKLPFYLYSYCLMPNHFHVLIEMQVDPVNRTSDQYGQKTTIELGGC